MLGSKSVTISSGRLFTPTFSNAREVRILFLGRRSINGVFQLLGVTRPYGETGIATADWSEKIYINLWGTNPTRIPNVPFNLCSVACRYRDDLLQANLVERRQTFQREIHAQCLSNICYEVLSDDYDDGWLEEDWSD